MPKKEKKEQENNPNQNEEEIEDLVKDTYQSVIEESKREEDEDEAKEDEAKKEQKDEKPEDEDESKDENKNEDKDEKTKKKAKKKTKKKKGKGDAEGEELEEKDSLDDLQPEGFTDVIAKDEEMEFPVTDLPGIGPATAHKLNSAGFVTIRSIALSSVSELVDNAEIGEKTATKLIKMCQEKVGLTFSTADALYTERLAIDKITTGSDNLDELFAGGMETESITELFGEFRTGKTQIAHQLCVTVQLPRERGGLEAGAAYIDTEGTFRPERIVEIARRFELDPKEVLGNITVGRAYTSDHQMELVRDISKIIKERNIRLLIVDSLTSHFRAEYVGRGTLAERQQKLNQHIHFLIKLSEMYHLAILVTNQVMARPDFFFGDPTAPIGGNIVAHSCTTRVYLRKSKQTKRVARIVDSPSLPEVETVFEILADGIHDG
ncbi:MAG: DNA repair and recombination protein RadA [Candidatus Heimdallarchaeota archaeon]|nr:DNA repair and recombination protein RadA [Candidatus Heimdallarchaeota archaeon]